MVAAFPEVHMRSSALTEDQILRLGAALSSLIFLVSAELAGDLAGGHMDAIGTICGAANAPHCLWCFGAAGLVLAGLAAFAVAIRPAPVPARRRRTRV